MGPSEVIATIKHRSASHPDAGGQCWEFSPVYGCDGPTVIARIAQGSRFFDALIQVCSSRHPREGAWVIRRISEECWRVSSARYGHNLHEITSPQSFAKGLALGSIDLVGAPPEIQKELAAIDNDPTHPPPPPGHGRRLKS